MGKQLYFGAAKYLKKVFAVLLVLGLFIGMGLDAPVVRAEDVPVLEDLLMLQPNIKMLTDAGGAADTGKWYAGVLDGSYTPVSGAVLTNVKFRIKSDDHVVLNATPAGQQTGYESVKISDHEIVITVYEIRSDGQGLLNSYGGFEFLFPNRTTAADQAGKVWIEEVSCETLVVTRDQWESNPAYDNILEASAIAKAENNWTHYSVEGLNTTRTVTRKETDYASGTEHVLNVASYAPVASLGPRINDGILPTTRYVNTEALEFRAIIQMSDGFVIDPALIATGTPTGDQLNAQSWTQVYSGTTALNATFAKYFSLSGTNLSMLDTYAMLDAGYATNHTIVLKFVSKSGADFSSVFNVYPTITMSKFYFATAIPAPENSPDTMLSGKVTVKYTDGSGDSSSFRQYDGSSVISGSRQIPASSNSQTFTVNLTPPKNAKVEAEDFVEKVTIASQPWNFSLTSAGDNLGITGDINRTYVSTNIVQYDSMTSIKMNRIWFAWDFYDTTFSDGVGRVVAEVNTSGYNGQEMNPIGFERPLTATGTSAEVWVQGATSIKVWDAQGLTAEGAVYFTAADADETIFVLNSGQSISGLSFVYKSATGVSLAYNPRVLFESEDQAQSITSKLFGLMSEISVYNSNYDESQTPAQNASKLLATDSCEGSVLYKIDFTDEVTGDKSYRNLDKGAADSSTPGDRLEYTIKVNGPEQADGTGAARGFAVLDERNEHLILSFPLVATATITRANASSTVMPTNNVNLISSETVNGKKVDTYTFEPFTNNFNITDPSTQMVFAFEGFFVQGDEILITYNATVSETAPVGADIVQNEVRVRLYGWGSGGAGDFDWADMKVIGSVKVAVQPVAPYGDVTAIVTRTPATSYSDAVNKKATGFVHGDAMNLYVVGGLITSGKKVEDPAYLIELPANMALTDLLSITGNIHDVTFSSDKRVLTDAGSAAATVTYYNSSGTAFVPTQSTLGEVRYLRVVFDGELDINQVISFNIPARAVYDRNTSGNNQTGRIAFLGADELALPVYANTLDGWGCAATSSMSEKWKLALENGRTPCTDYCYLVKNFTTKVYSYDNYVDITTTASRGVSNPARIEDVTDFTVTLKNNYFQSGLTSSKDLYIADVVDVLPVGMKLVGTQVQVGNQWVTVTVQDVQVTKGGRQLSAQRIVIPVNASIAPNQKLVITFSAKLEDTSILTDGSNRIYYYDEVNSVSLYYDPGTTRPVYSAKVRTRAADADKAYWWSWDSANATQDMNRLEATATVRIQEKRINPGVKTEAGLYTSSFTPVTQVRNISRPVIDWRVTVYNSSKAEYAMTDFTVISVLPFGVTYTGMHVGPAPTGVYENSAGQQVLYWVFDEALLSQATSASNIQDGGLKPNSNFQLIYKTEAASSVVGPCINYTYLAPRVSEYFEQSNISPTGTKVATDTEIIRMLNSFKDPTSQHSLDTTIKQALVHAGTINVLQQVSAEMSICVSNARGDVSSSFDPTPIGVGRGETVAFTYTFKNSGSGDAFKNIVLYNALPGDNDSYSLINKPRGSQFALEMIFGQLQNNPFTVQKNGFDIVQATYKVYFSSGTATSVNQWELLTWVESTNWNTSVQPKSFKIVFDAGVTVDSGDLMEIVWNMKVADDMQGIGYYAYNSAGIKFTQTSGQRSYPYSAEPAKCGVVMLGDYDLDLRVALHYVDMTSWDAQYFSLILEKEDPTYGWLRVDIKDFSGDSSAYVGNGKFTICAVHGETKRVYLGDLDEGNYRLTLVELGDGFTVTGRQQTIYLNKQTSGSELLVTIYRDAQPPPGPGPTDPDDPEVIVPVELEAPAEPEMPVIVPENPVPEAGPAWSLVNLICSILGVVQVLLLVIELIFRNRKKDEEEGQKADNGGLNLVLRIASVLASLAVGILFLLLEDMTLPMTMLTRWSYLIVPIYVVSLAATIASMLRRKQRDESSDI